MLILISNNDCFDVQMYEIKNTWIFFLELFF